MTILEALKIGRIDEVSINVRASLDPGVVYDQLAAELHIGGPIEKIEELWKWAEGALEDRSVKG